MAVLWLILKMLLWILLGLLALLTATLLAPVTAELGWSGEKGTWANVRVFGVRIRLFPRKEKAEKKKSKTPGGGKAPKGPAKAPPEQEKAPGAAGNDPQSGLKKTAAGQKAAKSAAPEKRFELTLDAVRGIAGTAGGFMGKVLAALRVHHIRVYLPVHGQDAAATALAVGRLHAVLGAALGALQNFFRLEFAQYELEPDYTGENAGKAFFSCKITAHAIIMLIACIWALVRLKKQHVI